MSCRGVWRDSGSRRCRGWLQALLCVLATSFALLPPVSAGQARALGEGVYVFLGDSAGAAPANRGEVGNIGFVVGEHGTVMINSGASLRHGRALLQAAEQIGGKPVVLVILTQPLQEFVMGAAAFAERGIPLLTHRASAELIGARCETCLDNLRALLGEVEMAGTRVIVPERLIDGDSVIEPGGRALQLIHPGWGSSPGDLIVRDVRSGVVFAGALASFGRVPELRDGRLEGWLAALARLEALSAAGDVIVPGYGPPGGAQELAQLRQYLLDADARVGELFATDTALSSAIKAADLPAYHGWARYQPVHGRNVQQLYLARERALLDD